MNNWEFAPTIPSLFNEKPAEQDLRLRQTRALGTHTSLGCHFVSWTVTEIGRRDSVEIMERDSRFEPSSGES